MEKLTDAEVVKALECCIGDGCSDCPYTHVYENCKAKRNNDCIELIKRKDAEIEKLKAELVSADEVIGFREAEIERLKEYESALKKGCALSKCINKPDLQREAYEELAENVYKFFCNKKNWKDFKEQWLENGECKWLKTALSNIVNATWGGVRNGQDNEGSPT